MAELQVATSTTCRLSVASCGSFGNGLGRISPEKDGSRRRVTLTETNSLHLKIDPLKRRFLLVSPKFSGSKMLVSGSVYLITPIGIGSIGRFWYIYLHVFWSIFMVHVSKYTMRPWILCVGLMTPLKKPVCNHGILRPFIEIISPFDTPRKFNIAPKNSQSQKKLIFQPSFFKGYVKFWGCN